MSLRGVETAGEPRNKRWFPQRDGGLPRRVATLASRLTSALGVIDAVIYGFDLATRPACPPNYVRLIDVEPVLLALSVILAVFGAGLMVLLGRRRPMGRAGIWASVGFGTLLGVLTCLLAATGLWLV